MNKLDKKKLCSLVKKKILSEQLDDYIKLVKKPKYVCTKCGRAANSDKNLCKPKEI
jgi:hypothetical protein